MRQDAVICGTMDGGVLAGGVLTGGFVAAGSWPTKWARSHNLPGRDSGLLRGGGTRRNQRVSSSLVKRGAVESARVRACAHWLSSSGQKATYTWSGGGGDGHALVESDKPVSVIHEGFRGKRPPARRRGMTRVQQIACVCAARGLRVAWGLSKAASTWSGSRMVRVTLWRSRVTRVGIGNRASVRVHTHGGFRGRKPPPPGRIGRSQSLSVRSRVTQGQCAGRCTLGFRGKKAASTIISEGSAWQDQ